MAKSYCGEYTVDFLTELMGLSGENVDIKEILENVKKTRGYYTDPDRHSNPPKWSDYYERIEDYLNNQEECFYKRKLIEEKWTYKFIGNETPSGIRVTTGNDKLIYSLVLYTDQFGFSAPRRYDKSRTSGVGDNYPYWIYLNNSRNDNKIYDVVHWVENTRTIGGSFVWPALKSSNDKWEIQYNRPKGVNSYIEDSVDLTLYEVMLYYKYKVKPKDDIKLFKETVLFKSEFKKNIKNEIILEKCPMKIWLDHFGTFEQYIKFFKFDDFVCKDEDGEMVPIDLVDGKPLNEGRVKGYMDVFNKKSKDEKRRIANKATEELEKILNRLSDMTLMRTARMLEVINNSESSKS